MFGPDIAIGYLMGWLWRKARRVAEDIDRDIDQDLDSLVEKLHGTVRRKLSIEPALDQLEAEASADSERVAVSPETRRRVEAALRCQFERDDQFAKEVDELLERIGRADPTGVLLAQAKRAAVGGDLMINAGQGVGAGVINVTGQVVAGRLIYQRAAREGRVARLGPRPSELVGREHLLSALRDGFTWPPTSPETGYLCGIGGVGKTSTAVEYAYRNAHLYGLVWQFNAEDLASLAGQINQLADVLGVLDAFDASDALTRIHAELAARSAPWLLLLDNVTDPGVVHMLTPSAGPGHVIVTSQLTAWPRGAVIEIPVLERSIAVDFMLTHAHDSDPAEAGKIVDALGCLPLALAQAATFLRSTGRSMPDYTRLLLSDPAKLLARGIPGDYGKAVAGAWSAAMATLESSTRSAVSLLRILACCAPDAVPVRLLLPVGTEPVDVEYEPIVREVADLTATEFSLDDALIALRGFSLISPPVRDAVSVHRLVQHVTLAAMNPQTSAAWQRATTELVARAIPADAYLPRNWPALEALFGHAHAVLPSWADGLLVLANYLGATGNHAAARDAARTFVEACEEHYGLMDPHTLYGRHCCARWTGRAGDATSARQQLSALLPLREQELGPEHPDTLSTRHNLAHWTGESGDETTARDMFAALLPIRVRVLGPDHPDSLDARHALANRTGRAGNPAAARDQFGALLTGYERIMGEHHPGTLTTRQALGHWTGESGDPESARRVLDETVKLREQVQGPKHPDTLSARRELAQWTGASGDVKAAQDMLTGLLTLHLEVQGPNHPDTQRTFASLREWTAEAAEG